jgi:hypothetical protein
VCVCVCVCVCVFVCVCLCARFFLSFACHDFVSQCHRTQGVVLRDLTSLDLAFNAISTLHFTQACAHVPLSLSIYLCVCVCVCAAYALVRC